MAEPVDRAMVAAEALARGRRNLAVQDYTAASDELTEACELYSEIYGPVADECGECYLLYAKALLGCAREEAKVLDITEQANENGEGAGDGAGASIPNGTASTSTANGSACMDTQSKTDDEKAASSSTSAEQTNGTSSKSGAESSSTPMDDDEDSDEDGDAEEGDGDAAAEGQADGDAESVTSDVGNLQLAWEVLELASQIYTRQGPPAKRLLAQVYSELGEVSLENGNFDTAMKDFGHSLELLESLEAPILTDIAEAHFKIGLSQSLLNMFEESYAEFRKAIEIVDQLITELCVLPEGDRSEKDKATITHLVQTKADIEAKIVDVQESKEQSVEALREQLRKVVPTTSDGAGPSRNGSSGDTTDAKPAANISHLVKRKSDTPVDALSNTPVKKATP